MFFNLALTFYLQANHFEIREIYVFIIILFILNAIITLRNKLQSDELHRGSFLL